MAQLQEVLVFLSLIVPSMALSFFVIRQGGLTFTLTAVATILRDLSLVSLVAFFVWRTGDGLRRIGWAFEHPWREVLLGAALFVFVALGAGFLEQLLRAAGLSSPSTPLPQFLSASGVSQFVLAGVLVFVVAVAEETIFRGYLILRFKALTGSSAAVLLSTIVFALGHGYEGSAGVVTVGAMGLAFALVYEWRKSLVAPLSCTSSRTLSGLLCCLCSTTGSGGLGSHGDPHRRRRRGLRITNSCSLGPSRSWRVPGRPSPGLSSALSTQVC